MMYPRAKYPAWQTLYHAKRHVCQAAVRRSSSMVIKTDRREAGRMRGRWGATQKRLT